MSACFDLARVGIRLEIETINAWMFALVDDDANVRDFAIDSLQRLGDDHETHVIRILLMAYHEKLFPE